MAHFNPLPLHFKGERDYIHGTDMLLYGIDVLNSAFSVSIEKLEFSIHKMTNKNLSLECSQAVGAPKLSIQDVAVLTFQSQGLSWCARWIEQDSIPTERMPYDESQIVTLCKLDLENKILTLQQETPFNFIETVVSMTKLLHQRLFPEVTAPWVFCRWSSAFWPVNTTYKGLSVQHKQKLGTKLSCCDVSLEGECIAQIYFSTREKP
jgi:hypothetical protein